MGTALAVAAATDPRAEHGQALLALGWSVFVLGRNKQPLANCPECPGHGASHDAASCAHLVCHGFYAATREPERLAAMLAFAPDGMLAVRTGQASGIAVIDAEGSADKNGLTGVDVLDHWDEWAGFSLPETLQAKTPSGGLHLVYAIPPGLVVSSKIRPLPQVDLKAEGGYIVAPPSEQRHWVNPAASAVLADGALLGWMAGARGRRSEENGSGEALGVPDGYDYDSFVKQGCPAGARDVFANDLAFRLRKAGVPRGFAETSARVMWERMDQPAGDMWGWEKMLGKLDHVWDTVEPEKIGVASSNGHVPDETVIDQVAEMLAHGEQIDLGAELTHTGLGMRFAKRFAGRYQYVPGLGWHQWFSTCWMPDELNSVLLSTKSVLLDLHAEAVADVPANEKKWAAFIAAASSVTGRNAMLTAAAVEPGMVVSVRDLNADPYQLVVQNGTIDLRTRQLRSSEPDDHNTRCAQVVYDPDADCPKWREHVHLVSMLPDGTPDPGMAAFLQRWAGYTLTGLVSEQKFFFGFGEGANGKNVLIETIVGMLGSYAQRGSTKIVLGGAQEHETVIADLAGARMVFIDETPQGRANEARLKELTGSARIRARKIAKDPFEFEATFKIWMAGNNRPRIDDTSEGFWRRMDLVPFDAVIPHERRVRDYARVLADERSGILNWCLEGLAAYLEQGLGQPDRVRIAGQEYRDEENIFGQFVDECFNIGAQSTWHPNNVLFAVYERWCTENGVRPLSRRALATEWHRNGFENDGRRYWIKQGSLGGAMWKQQRGWYGPPLTAAVPVQLSWTAGERGPE